MSYSTKQRDLILEKIKQENSIFTVKDLYEHLNHKVGLTTIYRYIQNLIKNNNLKEYSKNNKTYYQYLEKCTKNNHFYLKCEKCGNLKHIDCDCINSFYIHILKNHNFKLIINDILITGICDKCLKIG